LLLLDHVQLLGPIGMSFKEAQEPHNLFHGQPVVARQRFAEYLAVSDVLRCATLVLLGDYFPPLQEGFQVGQDDSVPWLPGFRHESHYPAARTWDDSANADGLQ
jgi:hypothetical protein